MRFPSLSNSSYLNPLAVAALLSLSALSIEFVFTDESLRWVAFALWLLSLVLFWIGCTEGRLRDSVLQTFELRASLPVLGLFLLALSMHFYQLGTYPFISIQDELRDGGLQARQIYDGTLKHLFAYGTYGSHGLLIPIVNIPFYLLFGDSALVYRVPAALIASLDVVLLYFLFWRFIGRTAAFLAALFLLLLPHHLYYARTEVVVVWSFFWSIVALWAATRLYTLRTWQCAAILGLVTGVCFSFHAAVRVVALLLSFVVLASSPWWRIKREATLKILACWCAGLVIALGPRLLFTPLEILFPPSRVPLFRSDALSLSSDVVTSHLWPSIGRTVDAYFATLQMYLLTGTKGWFPGHPILTLPLGLAMLVGAAWAIWRGTVLERLCLTLILTLPLVNSAITTTPGLEHRLAGCFPALVVLAACGLVRTARAILTTKLQKVGILAISVLILAFQLPAAYRFFSAEQATQKVHPNLLTRQLLLNKVRELLKGSKSSDGGRSICLFENGDFRKFVRLAHVKEYFIYFMPGLQIAHIEENSLAPTELALSLPPCDYARFKNIANLVEYKWCEKSESISCSRINGPLTIRVSDGILD